VGSRVTARACSNVPAEDSIHQLLLLLLLLLLLPVATAAYGASYRMPPAAYVPVQLMSTRSVQELTCSASVLCYCWGPECQLGHCSPWLLLLLLLLFLPLLLLALLCGAAETSCTTDTSKLGQSMSRPTCMHVTPWSCCSCLLTHRV
jgi:hypothetical protein